PRSPPLPPPKNPPPDSLGRAKRKASGVSGGFFVGANPSGWVLRRGWREVTAGNSLRRPRLFNACQRLSLANQGLRKKPASAGRRRRTPERRTFLPGKIPHAPRQENPR